MWSLTWELVANLLYAALATRLTNRVLGGTVAVSIVIMITCSMALRGFQVGFPNTAVLLALGLRAIGAELTDDDLAHRAQYLARVLHRLRPADTELTGLLALILLTRGRAGGRLDESAGQVLLGDAEARWGNLAAAARAWQAALVVRPDPALDARLADARALLDEQAQAEVGMAGSR